jgi:hypothetical protein
MAAGDSPVTLCNIGMVALGADPIATLGEDGTKASILCAQRYDQTRRATLRASTWNCAKRPVALAASATAPPWGYRAAYALPADFLRLVSLPDYGHATWDVMSLAGVGNCLLTDLGSPVKALYLFDLEDCTQMDALLVEAIGYAVGAVLAIPLGFDKALKSICEQERQARLDAARLINSQENSSKEWREDIWLRSRQ